MIKKGWIYLIVLVLLVSIVSAINIDSEVYDSLDSDGKVNVIVMLKDEPVKQELRTTSFDQKAELIRNQQDNVINSLKIRDRTNKRIMAISSEMLKEEIDLSTDEQGDSNLGTQYDFDLEKQYSIINGFRGELTKEGLQKLIEDGRVEGIYTSKILKTTLSSSVSQINGDDANLISINGQELTGSGQTVCILDTGIDTDHTAFTGRILDQYCYCQVSDYGSGGCCPNNAIVDTSAEDGQGHGTHVAGIAAGNDSTYRGVAYRAGIVSIKVCNNAAQASCDTFDIIDGIEWCVNNASIYNISVISMSLGGGGPYNSYCDASDASFTSAVNTAVGQNISVVVASGNDGFTNGISFPACIQNATPVGAIGDDDVTFAYNRGDILNLVAPGITITAPYVGGGTNSLSGTSMATPHVSGAVLLLQQFKRLQDNQLLSAFEIKDVLNSTGKSIYDSGSSKNYSRIDIFAGIVSLDNVAPSVSFVSPTPLNSSNQTSSSITINISASESLQNVTLEWNGTNESVLGNGESFYKTKTNLITGTYSFKVYVWDYANHSNISETRTFFYDSNPNISINHPTTNSFYNSLFVLNISVVDVNNISGLTYNITNSSALVQQNSNLSIDQADYTWTDLVNISNSTFTSGNYSLTVWANDSLGNQVVGSVTFIVDKTDPLINNLTISPTTIYANNSVIFTLNFTELYVNASRVYLESNVSGSWVNYSMQQQSTGIFNFTLGIGNLTNQQVIGYKAFVYDLAGNLNTSNTYSFTVQNRNITSVSIDSPSNGTTIEVGNSTSFNGSATDPDSDAITYSWNFGDGNTSSEQNSTNVYVSTGDYVVNLTATDGYGYSLSDNISIVVVDITGPVITDNSDSESHYARDGGLFTVSYDFFDYSEIKNATIYFDTTPLNYNSTYCSNMNSTLVTCSWAMSFTDPENDTGTYYIYVNTTDNSSSQNERNSTYSILLSSCQDGSQNGDETGTDCGGSCSACSTDSGTTGGSGGGGGGGGATIIAVAAEEVVVDESVGETVSETVGTETTTIGTSGTTSETYSGNLSLVDGQESTININNKEIPVSVIKIKAGEDKEVYVEVFSYKDAPEGVEAIEGAYRYLKIGEQLKDIKIKSVEIDFEIPVSWLTENNYSKNEVKLNSFIDGSWKQLKTKFVSENEEWIQYSAKVSQFPYFAITSGPEKESIWSKMNLLKLGTKGWVLMGLIGFILLLIILYFIVRE